MGRGEFLHLSFLHLETPVGWFVGLGEGGTFAGGGGKIKGLGRWICDAARCTMIR